MLSGNPKVLFLYTGNSPRKQMAEGGFWLVVGSKKNSGGTK